MLQMTDCLQIPAREEAGHGEPTLAALAHDLLQEACFACRTPRNSKKQLISIEFLLFLAIFLLFPARLRTQDDRALLIEALDTNQACSKTHGD